MNIMMLLEMAATAMGDRVASGPINSDFTYRRLFNDAAALAGRLRNSKAEYLVVCDESSPVLLTALFGAAWAGVPYVPLNYRLADNNLCDLAARVTPGLALTDQSGATRLAAVNGLDIVERSELMNDPAGSHNPIASSNGPTDLHAITDEQPTNPQVTPSQSPKNPQTTSSQLPKNPQTTPGEQPTNTDTPGDWPTDPDAVAVLLYTSGTTGPPKSAVLRQRHLVSYVFATVEFGNASSDEAHLLAVPPYHVASVAAQLSQLYAGRRIVPLPRFDANDWIDAVQRHHVTHAMVVPTMMTRIVGSLIQRGETLPQLRALAYGGGKSHRATVEQALKLIPSADFSHAYGLTETSSTVAVLGPEDHRRYAASDNPNLRQRLSSVGRPLPMLEISIRKDCETETRPDEVNKLGKVTHPDEVNKLGKVTHPGEVGEIWVRGEHVSGEYLETGSTLDNDGWFRTGDNGHIDSDGYLYVLGRNDDVIIRGAENMSPGEIEDALLTHPAVTDAAAFGVPSPQWGEEVVVAVVTSTPTPTADELRQTVRNQLRSSRVPTHVHFVQELPYTETGKLLRRVLRDHWSPLHNNTSPPLPKILNSNLTKEIL